jgi:hypothetical protein
VVKPTDLTNDFQQQLPDLLKRPSSFALLLALDIPREFQQRKDERRVGELDPLLPTLAQDLLELLQDLEIDVRVGVEDQMEESCDALLLQLKLVGVWLGAVLGVD